MENVNFEVKGNELIIKVDLSKRFGPSTSGKTQVVAKTGGNVRLNGTHSGIQFGLNVNAK